MELSSISQADLDTLLLGRKVVEVEIEDTTLEIELRTPEYGVAVELKSRYNSEILIPQLSLMKKLSEKFPDKTPDELEDVDMFELTLNDEGIRDANFALLRAQSEISVDIVAACVVDEKLTKAHVASLIEKSRDSSLVDSARALCGFLDRPAEEEEPVADIRPTSPESSSSD